MKDKIWKEVLSSLKDKVGNSNFGAFLKNTALLDDELEYLVIGVDNMYAKNWLEKKINKDLLEELKKYYPDKNKFKVIINQKESSSADELPLWEDMKKSSKEEIDVVEPMVSNLNKKYTFDSFVVGNNNRLAFAAAQVIADKPGKAYNPFFIYGGVGLGKTHLMHAVGNEILKKSPHKKILFTSCETFASEFIQALQTKNINDFKSKYRSIDVILVDDIQFLANKEGTQEEFFHTFNNLHQNDKQIIMTADRMPKDIPQMEDRLRSRLGWGMVADIQPPNYETRIAILQNKANEKSVEVDRDVLEYIAQSITNNVRELEGCLTKLIATSELDGKKIDMELCLQTINNNSKLEDKNLSTKKYISTVAKYFDIETMDILGKKRVKELVYPRQITMYLLREIGKKTYPQIGEALGGKDHTTVMHSYDKIARLLKTEPKTETDINNIQQLLYS